MTAPSGTRPTDGRQTNRRWFAFIALAPVVVLIVVLLEIFTDGSAPEPVTRPLVHPAGYRAITDAYFGYVIPDGYQENKLYTDAAGDIFYGDQQGWVAENLSVLKDPPGPTRRPPEQLATYGVGHSVPYRLGPASPIRVPGTSRAWRYEMTRPDGFEATVLQVWEGQSSTELWLQVRADAATTATVTASLSGYVPAPAKR